MTKLYYIHGFNSSPTSDTVKSLQKEFPNLVGLTYDFENPKESIDNLTDQILSDFKKSNFTDVPIIIGSSLGGWYAEQLTSYLDFADFIMYNPAIRPHISLSQYGVDKKVLNRYYDSSYLEKSGSLCTGISRNVLLSQDDDVIPYQESFRLYNPISKVQIVSGGHRMNPNIGIVVDLIKKKIDNNNEYIIR